MGEQDFIRAPALSELDAGRRAFMALMAAEAASATYADGLIKAYGIAIIAWLAYLATSGSSLTVIEGVTWLVILLVLFMGVGFCLVHLRLRQRRAQLVADSYTDAATAVPGHTDGLARKADRASRIATWVLAAAVVLAVSQLAYTLYDSLLNAQSEDSDASATSFQKLTF